MGMRESNQADGIAASSAEFARFDQVPKPLYHLDEAADGADAFDEEFEFTTCDLGRYLNGDAHERAAFSQELGHAIQEIGFAILTSHGIDQSLFDDADQAVREFFTTTPLASKLDYRAERHGAVSEGYFPIKETSDIQPDLVEGWVFGRRAFDLDADVAFDAHACWPSAEFEAHFRPLVEAESALFQPIMQSLLSFLGSDPHSYDARLSSPNFGLRLNYYPPLTDSDESDKSGRLLGHEDVDLFTLLPAPAVEGLQVLHRSGKWVRLAAPPGTIILNSGDYLQRISNDLLPSTTHRVSRPRTPALEPVARVSFPLAAYLRPDENLEVLPELPEPKYEPIKVITFHTRTTAKFYGADYAVETEES